jgi:hypothetical protein
LSNAVERIVVQVTPQDKKAVAAKARRLDLPVSELMRRGAFAYQADQADAELAALADAAKAAADRAVGAIDDALRFIEASNRRIDALQPPAQGAASRSSATPRTATTRRKAA